MSRVTIKTIASDLGISHMTVSRALSDHPNVQAETRQAVLKRARELGYVKSAVAMVMRGNAPRIVGLLLPNIANEFYARFANDMALACEAHSLQLVIHLTNDDLSLELQALDRLREIQAASVVMVPAPGQRQDAENSAHPMRIIELIRQSGTQPAHQAILVDDAPAITEAVLHLAQNGHSRIAYIGANRDLSSGRDRLAAFARGADAAGLTIPADMIATGAPSFAMGSEHAHRFLRDDRVTALVCGGFEISNGALSALMAAKAERAREVAFIGYGDPSFYAWIDRGISTVHVPVTELAHHATALITAQEGAVTMPTRSFPARLILR